MALYYEVKKEICCSEIRKTVGIAAFFEKSYKNTRTICATAFAVACIVFYVWPVLLITHDVEAAAQAKEAYRLQNGTLECETLSRE